MNIISVLQVMAAILTMLTGLLALVKPSSVYGFIGLSSTSVRGVSEIRSIFGGLFIALGLAPLFLGSTAFFMLGICYLAIAIVRLFSIIFEKSTERSNLISLGIEIVLGFILIL